MLVVIVYDDDGNPDFREVSRKEYEQLQRAGAHVVRISENYARENVIYTRRIKPFTRKCAHCRNSLARCGFVLRDREEEPYCSTGCLLEGLLREAGFAYYEEVNRLRQ